jgi:hypothetical protein
MLFSLVNYFVISLITTININTTYDHIIHVYMLLEIFCSFHQKLLQTDGNLSSIDIVIFLFSIFLCVRDVSFRIILNPNLFRRIECVSAFGHINKRAPKTEYNRCVVF